MNGRDRRDSVLVDLAIDAARVTDDFVRGVLENTDGRAGGGEHVRRGWRRFIGGGAILGEQAVVRAMGARYAPEQLRKAAAEADDFVRTVDDLAGAWTPPALAAAGRLGALGVRQIPDTLRAPDIGAGSPDVAVVHQQLAQAIAILNEARARVVLAEMRAARDQAR